MKSVYRFGGMPSKDQENIRIFVVNIMRITIKVKALVMRCKENGDVPN
jgi:hypothetical protein